MKNRITGIFLVIVLLIINSKGVLYAKETPDELKNLYAQSAVLMDADSGRILFGKNESEILPMASTTKIMTCILTLENMKENEIGIVSEIACKQPKVHLNVKCGEKYFLKDLLYSLMLESHNDSAVIIAETIGGTVSRFADMMNQKAKEIGCCNTYFITPNGLDASDDNGVHSTTAADLAKIMRYCIFESPKKDEFIKISRTDSFRFQDVDNNRYFVCNNHNAFLQMMDGVIAGKTGFTNNAGYCYVGALQNKGRTFIVTVLACGWPNNRNYKWLDTKKLMEYGINNYEYCTIKPIKRNSNIQVMYGMDPKYPLKKNIYTDTKELPGNNIQLLMHKNEMLDSKIIMNKKIYAPVRSGQKLGTIYYMIEKDIIMRRDIIAVDDIQKKSILEYMNYIMRFYVTLKCTQSVNNVLTEK